MLPPKVLYMFPFMNFTFFFFFFAIFVTPNTSFAQLQVCLSLTDHGWVVNGHEVSSGNACPIFYQSMPVLLCSTSHIPASQVFCCDTTVYFSTLCHCVGHRYLILHRITAYSCYLYIAVVVPYKDKQNQRKSDIDIWSIRKKNMHLQLNKVKQCCRQVKKTSDSAGLANPRLQTLQTQNKPWGYHC